MKTKGFLGINKRGSNKTRKSYKNGLVNKVVDYLKSDYYMFAPLVSSPPSDISNPNQVFASSYAGLEAALTPTGGKNKYLLDKVEEYLKLDLYMYSPMVEPQLSKTVLAASPLTEGTTTSSSPKKNVKETEQLSKSIGKVPLSKGSVVRRPISLRETVKHIVHRNCRLCSVPGKKVIETRRGKLVG